MMAVRHITGAKALMHLVLFASDAVRVAADLYLDLVRGRNSVKNTQDHQGGFVCYMRRNIKIEAGVWRGDAVYSTPTALPCGSGLINGNVVRTARAETDIPTV